MPDQRLDGDWPFPHRLSLGAGWRGSCTAIAGDEIRPNDHELRTACNMGYAKGCARLPEGRTADAVRFAPGEERDGFVRIRYACERDYLPVTHGELVHDSATGRWPSPHANACLQRMAECYLETQMARRRPPAVVSLKQGN
jgi:hypothetical protein